MFGWYFFIEVFPFHIKSLLLIPNYLSFFFSRPILLSSLSPIAVSLMFSLDLPRRIMSIAFPLCLYIDRQFFCVTFTLSQAVYNTLSFKLHIRISLFRYCWFLTLLVTLDIFKPGLTFEIIFVFFLLREVFLTFLSETLCNFLPMIFAASFATLCLFKVCIDSFSCLFLLCLP